MGEFSEKASTYMVPIWSEADVGMFRGRLFVRQRMRVDAYEGIGPIRCERLLTFGGEWMLFLGGGDIPESCLFEIPEELVS